MLQTEKALAVKDLGSDVTSKICFTDKMYIPSMVTYKSLGQEIIIIFGEKSSFVYH